MQKVVAEIHLGNIRRNAELFKKITGAKLCAVVKANAYGHGAEEVAYALSDIADCFAVALVDEGLQIRSAACGKDILVFSPPITEEARLQRIMQRNSFSSQTIAQSRPITTMQFLQNF